ncbi:MAG: sigma-70 family RNA polymerase sigma factor [Bacteroidales bacterium]|nr:sigma-70 family RNA polymerase sigma factor [Bacteroidales bacterium]
MTPSQLLYKIKQDDERAFRELFDQQYDRLYRLAYYYLQRADWAEEVALDVLADLWNGRATLVVPDDFERYTMVVVRHAAISMWRREQRFAHDESDEESLPDVLVEGVDEATERVELFAEYERVLTALPPRCREIWQLVKEEGLSYNDVADQLGISTKTVDAQIQKAFAVLRTQIGAYLERQNPHSTRKMHFLSLFLI